MATLVLQAAGAFVGGLFGSLGATIGGAAGAIGGYLVDQSLIASTRHITGSRLSSMQPMTAEEGASLPKVYGAARVSGTLIWATRFEEKKSTSREGAKGGPRVTTYSYFANMAFAIAEGPIGGIRRIWADGSELDRSGLEVHVYHGDEAQLPDPLIEAKQGESGAPAYRGTAYVVFEHFPLADYGNRIPQLSFEVLRPVGALAEGLRSVVLIPGATEFGLSPTAVTCNPSDGKTQAFNRNALRADSDWIAALDELQALAPNLQSVSLVVPWFGDDMRAGNCTIRPGVTHRETMAESEAWSVEGIGRADARLISTVDERAAYGGTPSDASVLAAIADLKARGLKVTLYPLVMMDIPAGNGLPDPWGGMEQAAYPWRGRITCFPAPLQPSSADRTGAADAQLSAFIGGAIPANFAESGGNISYSGNPSDWGYRRFVLHYARLAALAGGVDAFLIGSELRGLTTVRGAAGTFPLVDALCTLAADVRGVVGSGTALTYAADWSEYFGYHPVDGTGDVHFHLDPLWAHSAIGAVGIDNYMPLSDWRDEDYAAGNTDGFSAPYDLDALQCQIAGGEGHDNLALEGWWANPHYDRVGGVENALPSAWIPQSKPIWFTELGCPAVDKGPNQPNVFLDPKSSESAAPHFSDGSRSDLAQNRFLRAHLRHWAGSGDGAADPADNPVSPVYGGPMVDPGQMSVWAWDTRPFPEFPLDRGLWGDGENWRFGHWLNGRLSGVAVDELITAILGDFGISGATALAADGFLSGYVVSGPGSVRDALDPLLGAFGIDAFESGDGLVFRSDRKIPAVETALTEFVDGESHGPIQATLADRGDLPGTGKLDFVDAMRDYQSGEETAERAEGRGQGTDTLQFPGGIEHGQAHALAEDRLTALWTGRSTIAFDLPWREAALEVGDTVVVDGGRYRVTKLEDGTARHVEGRSVVRNVPFPDPAPLPEIRSTEAALLQGPPLFSLLDLPLWPGAEETAAQFRIACFSDPWRRASVFASPETTGYTERATVPDAATMGVLSAPLAPASAASRLDRSATMTLRLCGGALAPVSVQQLLNGANTAFLLAPSGRWEVMQFLEAEEIAADTWTLSGLLRGQLGTDAEAAIARDAGAAFVLLDDAVAPAGLKSGEAGLMLNWRVGLAGRDFSDRYYTTVSAEGGLRALEPLSPVHLRDAIQSSGDVDFTWIRRGRIDADNWLGSDIPLGEESEAYVLQIFDGPASVRTVELSMPQWTYTGAERTADLGGLSAPFDVSVSMISTRFGPGAAARITVTP